MPVPCRVPVYPELAAELARTGRPHAHLAAAVGCATATISQIIRGHARPSAALRQRIADALGRDVDELFVFADHFQRLVDLAVEQGLGRTVNDAAALERRILTLDELVRDGA